MVKKTILFALSALLILVSVVVLVAGEFSASVSSTQVQLNENFALTLTLKGTSPKDTPAISTLTTDFLIHSQQHSTNTTIINGKVSTSISWRLSLTPKTEGTLQIPPITVDTDEGPVSTQPITLNVVKGSNSQSDADSIGLTFAAEVSNASPYKNEPILYTAYLTSKMPLYNLQMQKLEVEEAIVELVQEPKLEEKVIDGVLLNVLKLEYLITPLKPGFLTIPPVAIQGAIPQKRTQRRSSIFDDDIDPFAIMQGYGRLKNFTLMTDEIRVDVQPALSMVSPWLPAKAIYLEEQWQSNQTLQVGVPFSRSFVIKAEGIKVSQLPHLEYILNTNASFKVYADKPEEEETISQGTLYSQRKEQYTLIPQKEGPLVLPEISINWWDTARKEVKTSVIPARTIEILPALETVSSKVHEPSQSIASSSTTAAATNAPIPYEPPYLLYGIIGGLLFVVVAVLIWAFALQKKVVRLSKDKSQKATQATPQKTTKALPKHVLEEKNDKKEKLPDLNPT